MIKPLEHQSPAPASTPLLTCAVCKQQIPADEAMSEEAADYVFHLCGPACFAEWQAELAKRDKHKPGS